MGWRANNHQPELLQLSVNSKLFLIELLKLLGTAVVFTIVLPILVPNITLSRYWCDRMQSQQRLRRKTRAGE